MVFGSDDLQKTTVTGISAGTINIYLEVSETDLSGGTCGRKESSRLTLTIGNRIFPPSVSPGAGTICDGQALNLFGNSTSGASYTWSVTPNAPSAFSSTTSVSTIFTAPTVSEVATFKVNFKVNNSGCEESTDVDVKVYPALSATIENGSSAEVCLAGELALEGTAAGGTNTHTHSWTKVGGTGTENISTLLDGHQHTSNPVFKTPANATVGTTYNLEYTVTDELGCNPAKAAILITIRSGAAPIAIDQTHTQCSDAESNFTLQVAAGSVPATSWNLNAVNIPTGFEGRKWNAAAPSSGLSPYGLIEDAYVNSTNSPIQVIYTMTPLSSIGCVGNPVNVTFNILPAPVTLKEIISSPICGNAPIGIELKTTPASVPASYWEIWRVSVPEGVTSGNDNAVAERITAAGIENDKFVNTTDETLIVEYLIQPFSTGDCNSSLNSIRVPIVPQSLPDNIDAGANQLNNCATITVLNASDNSNGEWTVLEGDGNHALFEPTNPRSEFLGTAGQTYKLAWSVSSSFCATSVSDEVTISIDSEATLDNSDLEVNDNAIASGVYQAGVTLNSSGIVEPGSSVTFQALREVNLKVGFHAKAGSNFLAKIDACQLIPTLLIPEIDKVTFNPVEAISHKISMDISPNPFSAESSLYFNLLEAELVSINLYNQTGQLIKSILNQQPFSKGNHSISLTNAQIPPGFFYVNMTTKNDNLVKKAILVN